MYVSDIAPEQYRQQLSTLFDSVPPQPMSVVKTMIELELGHKMEDMFSSFTEKPLGAGMQKLYPI